MTRCSLLFLLLNFVLFVPSNAQSYKQRQNYIWNFCFHGTLDFNNNPPAPLLNLNVPNTSGSVGTVCDGNGVLQFYTDGDFFYDRNNNLMPHGYDVTGLAGVLGGVSILSSTLEGHSPQIIPMPGHPSKYYVFTITTHNTLLPESYWYRIYYSIIDMTLNGGLGDVVPGQGGILFDSSNATATCIAGVVGNDCNYWLLTHSVDSNIFRNYEITSAGISSNPVVSQVGAAINTVGYLVLIISPNRSIIFLGGVDRDELFSFDPGTGIVGPHSPEFAAVTWADDAAFSPDNTKLYLKDYDGWGTNAQYDLTSAVPDTPTLLFPGAHEGGMRLGPDGKIYFLLYGPGQYELGSINTPDQLGAACQFDSIAIIFPQGVEPEVYFPNEVPVLAAFTDTVETKKQDYICYNGTKKLQATDTTSTTGYLWQDSLSGNCRVTDTPGTYIVTYNTFEPCTHHIDTFLVTAVGNIKPDLGPDTIICDSGQYLLHASVPGVAYLWSDSSNDSELVANNPGTYWLQVSADGCTASDTVSIQFINLRQDLGTNDTVCAGDPIQLKLAANVPAGATALWSSGSNLPSVTATDTGTYWVMVSYPPSCIGSDTIQIVDELCHCHIEMPNAFTPNEDGKNDVFRPVIQPGCEIRGYLFSVYNRWGQLIFSSTIPEQGWDGTENGVPANIDTYMYVVQMQAGTSTNISYQHGDVELIR